MERRNIFESGNSESQKKGKDGKPVRQGEFAAALHSRVEISSAETPPEAKPPVAERPRVPVTPLEGIISWRDQESEPTVRDASEEKDDDDEEDDDGTDASDSKTAASPAVTEEATPEKTADETKNVKTVTPPAAGHTAVPPTPKPLENAGVESDDLSPAETATLIGSDKPLPEFSKGEFDELPPIIPRTQETEAETPVPPVSDSETTSPRPETGVGKDVEWAFSIPREERERGIMTDTDSAPDTGGGYEGNYPLNGSNPAYRGPFAETQAPAGTRHENPVEYLPRPHTHGGILALLGLEHLARKSADRGVEKRLGERLVTEMREQGQRSDDGMGRLERLQRDSAAEQQRHYRTHEAQQRRYESLHAPALTPEMQRRPEMNQLPPILEKDEPEAPRQIRVEPKQHIEHSTWHNIVVDKRGREVVGAIQYGEGFQSERRKEMARGEQFSSDSTMSGAQGAAPYSDRLPSGLTTPTLPSGPTLRSDMRHRIGSPKNQVVPGVSNGWLWTTILLVIAAFLAVAFL